MASVTHTMFYVLLNSLHDKPSMTVQMLLLHTGCPSWPDIQPNVSVVNIQHTMMTWHGTAYYVERQSCADNSATFSQWENSFHFLNFSIR